MLAFPLKSGFWCDPPNQYESEYDGKHNTAELEVNDESINGQETTVKELDNSSCRSYRAHFLKSEHFNFCCEDDMLGPLVLSLKYYSQSESISNHIRIILRLATGTRHMLVECKAKNEESPLELARLVCPDLTIASLQPVMCPTAEELLLNYDEHVLVTNFKFGVLYQREGQSSEESIFGNKTHSYAMDKFLDMIGSRVALSEHNGYRGGLDTKFGQTGQNSVYTKHVGNEVMFHVATLLPFSETDPQQLERKRHIGNDIVSVVFQEGSTPFSPDMVTSHFLHTYIVVQPEPGDVDSYRVSVTARADVPYFGPSLPSPPVFRRGPECREWILNKLINAELSSYKADKFKQLKQRTQEALLGNLSGDLAKKTDIFLGSLSIVKTTVVHEVPASNSFFRAVKRVFASRRKSQSHLLSQTDISDQSDLYEEADSGCASLSSRSAEHAGQVKLWSTENDSFETVEEEVSENVIDEDMKSAIKYNKLEADTSSNNANYRNVKEELPETIIDDQMKVPYSLVHADTFNKNENDLTAIAEQVTKLQHEVGSLKMDKQELIRHNMDVQDELNKLRERELKLQTDLIIASRELNSLRDNLDQREYLPE